MNLDHFADPFQNDHAGLDQVWGQSNSITEQYNPGYPTNVGTGFAQDPSSYEWEGGSQSSPVQQAPQEFRGNGGSHGIPPAQCGGGQDPLSLQRANMEYEERMNGRLPHEHLPPHLQQQLHQYHQQQEEQEPQEMMAYSGPDDFDNDDDEENPRRGMAFWKKRIPTLLTHGAFALLWLWLWSTFGFSNILTGNPGKLLFYGFPVFLLWGVFSCDHRAARYDEEREIMTSVESNLKKMATIVAAAGGMILSFKVLKGKSQGTQYAVHAALGSAFFVSLLGMMNFSTKKRGETVRRYRKMKGAALNLSIALLAVAALLVFNVGTSSSPIIVKQSGGATSKATTSEKPHVIVLKNEKGGAPAVEQPQSQPIVIDARGDQSGGGMAAPTVLRNNAYEQQPMSMAPTYSPQSYSQQSPAYY